MNQGRIIVITGAPGTGKTTTASVVAKESDLEKSVHMCMILRRKTNGYKKDNRRKMQYSC